MKDFLLAMVAVILAATPKSAGTTSDKIYSDYTNTLHTAEGHEIDLYGSSSMDE
jgi:hypothetical protein